MKILKFKEINKGFMVGNFDLMIPKWGNFIIREMTYFKKNEQRWLSFPSKQYEADGKKKYYSYNTFEDPKMSENFQKAVFEELDKFIELSKNQSQPQSVEIDSNPVPF